MINQLLRAADTRTRLVLAAMRLFSEKGYNSTSIADVLHSAKVNSGSLYYFFPGKSELLAAVLDMYHDGIGPMLLEPAWAGVSDPVERIFALLTRYRKSLLDTDCFYGCPIGSLALELHEPDPAVRERLAKNFSAWIDAIAECLSQAKARLPAGQHLRELAQFVLTIMEGGVMQARTFRDIEYFDAAVRQLRHYFQCLEPAGREAPRKKRVQSQLKTTREKNHA
jgi:TetR/AcrR family transcriptional regulator, transcriptional repressor for nem operon